MKLSMGLIARRLERYDPKLQIRSDSLSISGVRFLTDSRSSFSRDYVYLSGAEGYFQDPQLSDAMILASGSNHILCRGADREELLNDVLSSFDYYNGLEQLMYSAAAEHAPLSKFLEVSYKLLGGAMFVFGIDGDLLARSNPSERRIPGLGSITESMMLGSEQIGSAYMDELGRMLHDLTDSPQIMYRMDDSRFQNPSVCLYLSKDNERIGFVLFFPDEKKDAAQAAMLLPMICAQMAEAEEYTDRASVHQTVRSVLRQLLEGEKLPEIVVGKMLKQASLEDPFALVLCQSMTIQNYTMHNILVDEMAGEGIPLAGCDIDDRIAMLISEKNIGRLVNGIQRHMPQGSFKAGVSMPFQRVSDLGLALSQARFALESEAAGEVRYCRELALAYELDVLRSQPMTQSLLHPAVMTLLRYDEEHDAELWLTLREFLYSMCSQSTAARKLHVHLNTLKYRLSRIVELTEVDLEDPQERFYLELSARLLDKPAKTR